ncbi:MFS transporter [Pyrococcus furiosus DSM 3638]|uniref:MFS transporter n=3 Tax=Pyrococcus furiosus TaxID=2261 RepID=A0A5C0XNV3_PYRFU|nr:MFS transporter [Pyrococcus furiosus]AAL80950.1 putative transport membrane protein [Pyrococcus furiosus DSM 3638]AFN03614.1 transport membrane protein [Pyrococcus furiosus COM1]QEK78499.1 MFS transporter [Pyrococcus furiosus DSM 3638]
MKEILLLALISLGWIFNYSHRMAVPALAPLIREDLGIGNAEIGLLMTSLLLPYALIQVPAGYLGDRFGRKKMVVLSIIGYSLSSALIFVARDYWELVGIRALYGFFAGLYYAPATALISEIFKNRKGSALGIFMIGPPIGSGITPLIVVPIALTFSWRTSFLVLSLMSTMVGILLLLTIKEDWKSVGRVSFSIPRGVILLSIANFLGMSAFFAVLTFLVSFLVDKGMSVEKAGLAFSLLSTFGILGSILGGFVYDRIGKRSVLLAYLLNSLFTFLILVNQNILILVLLGLAIYSVGGIVTAYTAEKSRKDNLGVVMGFVNMMGFFGATVGPYVVGVMIDSLGYSNALLFVPISYLLAATLIFLDEKLH